MEDTHVFFGRTDEEMSLHFPGLIILFDYQPPTIENWNAGTPVSFLELKFGHQEILPCNLVCF